MAGNEGLFKALQMLENSVGEFAQSSAILNANEKVQQIKDSQLDDADKMHQIRQAANTVAAQLYGMGVPADRVQGVFNMYAPKQHNGPIQTFEQGEAQALADDDAPKAEMFRKARQSKEAFQERLLGQKGEQAATVANINAAGKIPDKQVKALNDFRSKIAKSELEGMDALEAAPGEVSKGNLAYVMNLKSLLKRSDPRISDMDYSVATPNVSGIDRVNRVYDSLVNNKPLPDDVEAVNDLITALKNRTERRIREKAKGFAGARANKLSIDPAQLESDVLSEALPNSATQRSQSSQQPTGNLPPGFSRSR